VKELVEQVFEEKKELVYPYFAGDRKRMMVFQQIGPSFMGRRRSFGFLKTLPNW
jgi:hypothetical protein